MNVISHTEESSLAQAACVYRVEETEAGLTPESKTYLFITCKALDIKDTVKVS